MLEPEEKEVLVEQTRFNQIEPLFDRDDKTPVVQPHPKPSAGTPPTEAKKSAPNRKPLMLAAGVLGFLVLLIIILAALSRMPKGMVPVVPKPTPVDSEAQQTEFEKRVGDVQKQLEASDPTKQDLVFPPVDMTIRLDKKQL